MLQRKANTYRLYPTSEQRLMLFQIAGACRAVYNLALEQRRDWWQKHQSQTGKTISFAGQCRELTDLRREVDWLREAPIHPLQQALRDLDRAYQGFFAGRSGYPSPRKKGNNDSFRFPDPTGLKVERTGKRSGRIKLPKLGWVAFRGWFSSRNFLSEAGQEFLHMSQFTKLVSEFGAIVIASSLGLAGPMSRSYVPSPKEAYAVTIGIPHAQVKVASLDEALKPAIYTVENGCVGITDMMAFFSQPEAASC